MRRMTVARLIAREMRYTPINTVLCVAVVLASCALLVALAGIHAASVDETRVLMKALGFNLLIVARDADPARWQALDFSGPDMPEDYVKKLAAESSVMAQHFVGKYQRSVLLEGCTAVLTGVVAESVVGGAKMQPMPTAYEVPDGRVYLGAAVARALRKNANDPIDILGKTFTVGRVLEETGVMPDDIRVFAPLHEVQSLLGCHRQQEIERAFHAFLQLERLLLQLELARLDLREVQGSILLARDAQRTLVERLSAVALGLVLAGAAVALWGLTHQNVSHRRREISVLRALGVSDTRIALVFIGKIALYAVAGAVLGCVAGAVAARQFNIAAQPAVVEWPFIRNVVLAAPLFSMIASLPPIVSGLLREPTSVLGEDA
ncbi:MAG: FtsX-like permease family protein [Candidatus Hydrogenedentes bacterium]|nr:FtsX-like permease family protein [Candidatus Hydrogenedentota bacterium]